MDMTASLEAKSDQLNAVDLVEPRTFTIEKITEGNSDQPFNFFFVELPGKPYRPSKGMRRIIAQGWGAKNIETNYPGRRLTLFCEPEVKWAGAPVGGIRVSHMSHIDKAFSAPLAESKQKRVMYRVEPLVEATPTANEPTAEDVAGCNDPDTLRKMWGFASPERKKQIEARVADLQAEPAGEPGESA